MPQVEFSASLPITEIKEESDRLFKAVERKITEPMELQEIRDLKLELRAEKHLQDQLKQSCIALADHNFTSEATMLAEKMLDLVSDEHIEKLNAKLLQLENLRERNRKNIDSVKDALDVFQTDKQNEKVFKTMSEELIDGDKLTLLESRLRKMEAENEKLSAKVCAFQKNEEILIQNNKNLATEIARLYNLTEKKHAENLNLGQKIIKLEDQVIEAEADKWTQVNSVEEKLQAEIKRMNSALHSLQEKNDSLLDQNSCVVAELVQVKSQRDELKKEILNLRKLAQDLEDQRVNAEYEIIKKEDEIEKQNRIIADQQEQINDLNEDREMTGQITQDLKDQLSLLQEENISADVQNLREFQRETAESEEIGDPVAELPPNMVQNSGSWSRCAKRLLKVGLGLALTSLLTPTGISIPLMYYSWNAGTSYSPSDNTYNLLKPYCNFEHGSVPF